MGIGVEVGQVWQHTKSGNNYNVFIAPLKIVIALIVNFKIIN